MFGVSFGVIRLSVIFDSAWVCFSWLIAELCLLHVPGFVSVVWNCFCFCTCIALHYYFGLLFMWVVLGLVCGVGVLGGGFRCATGRFGIRVIR